MLLLAQLPPSALFDRYGLTGDVVGAAADYSVIGATVGVFAAMLAKETSAVLATETEPGIDPSYGEWGSVGAAAAATVVLLVGGA